MNEVSQTRAAYILIFTGTIAATAASHPYRQQVEEGDENGMAEN